MQEANTQEVNINVDDKSIETDILRKYSSSSINSVLLAGNRSISSSLRIAPLSPPPPSRPPSRLPKQSILKSRNRKQNGYSYEEPINREKRSSSLRDMLDLITLEDVRQKGGSDEDAVDEELFNRLHDSLDNIMPRRLIVMKRMRFITAIVGIGGFLSGYSVGVIPGALLPLQKAFALNRRQSDMLVTCLIFSAFASSFVGGVVNGYLGRRKAIMVAAMAFSLGSIVLFTAQDPTALFYGEILIGTAIGIESMTSPLYIAEVVKPSVKGTSISMYTLMIMVGQVVAGIISGILGPIPNGWRYLFGLALLPSLILLIGFYKLPESPPWLMIHNKRHKAQTIYESLRDFDQEVKFEMSEFENSLTHTGAGGGYDFVEKPMVVRFMDMIQHGPTRRALYVGCGLMLLQQFCGINAVIYFAAPLYQLFGFTEATSIWLSCVTVVSQIVGQFINITIVEKVRRRVLVLSSLILVAFSTTGLGISFYIANKTSQPVDLSTSVSECTYQPKWLYWENDMTINCFDCVQMDGCGFCDGACVTGSVYHPDVSWMCPGSSETSPFEYSNFSYYSCRNPYKWLAVSFLNLFVFVFGLGMASVPWIVNTELFPPQHISLAVGISTAANWMGNLIISSSFLELSDSTKLTSYGTFFLYSIISFLGAIWIYFVLPETMDSTSIDSEDFFTRASDDHHECYDDETTGLNKKQKVTFSAYDTIVFKTPTSSILQ